MALPGLNVPAIIGCALVLSASFAQTSPEVEHVIEQMEGISLAQLADERQNGVTRLADGAFETRRAQAAGRAAAHEVDLFAQAERQARADARALRRQH